jgi:hypothetical protein
MLNTHDTLEYAAPMAATGLFTDWCGRHLDVEEQGAPVYRHETVKDFHVPSKAVTFRLHCQA